jgi:dihydroorotate dehydrogenase
MSPSTYNVAKNILFKLDAERAHDLTLVGLKTLDTLGLLINKTKSITDPTQVMGLTFDNKVGLSAGMDKNGDYIHCLRNLGFGFLEIGTVTPKPQYGNPKPRMFRIPETNGIINRLGFNNKGVDYLVSRIKKTQIEQILGVNIGKNKDTPIKKAQLDYEYGLRKSYPFADYITINISSPNTENLRSLQDSTNLHALLNHICVTRDELKSTHGKYKPIAVKVAPDLDNYQLAKIVEYVQDFGLDAIIATNTTIQRPAEKIRNLSETGGLSGGPLTNISTKIVEKLAKLADGSIPIIGVGGISTAQDAIDKVNAGASLVQIYSGLIYKGPQLVMDCAKAISS